MKVLNAMWWRRAAHLGWSADFNAFVLPRKVLGDVANGRSSESRKSVPPAFDQSSPLSKLATEGDLDALKKGVADAARWSSPIALALSAAFAAPLMGLINWPTFLLVLFHTGKVGKSTAARAASSVIGIGTEDDLPNWNFTDASLEELAQCFNDLPLIMNGLESSGKRDTELRDLVKKVAYILNDGQGRRRSIAWKGGGGVTAKWRTIVLVTSEQAFDRIAASVGQPRSGGELARAFDVPAVIDGHANIIDSFPGKIKDGKQQQQEWARNRVVKVRQACVDNRGVALEAYLKHLLELLELEPTILKKNIETARNRFIRSVDEHLNGANSEPMRHAAQNFSVVFAGGVQAIAAKLLPLSEDQLLARIKRCFLAGLEVRANRPDPLLVGLMHLKAGLDQLDASRSPKNGKFDKREMPWPGEKAAVSVYRVHAAELLMAWFGNDDVEIAAVLDWLAKNALLEGANLRRATYSIDNVRRVQRLNGKSVSCIVMRDPRPFMSGQTVN